MEVKFEECELPDWAKFLITPLWEVQKLMATILLKINRIVPFCDGFPWTEVCLERKTISRWDALTAAKVLALFSTNRTGEIFLSVLYKWNEYECVRSEIIGYQLTDVSKEIPIACLAIISFTEVMPAH